MLSWNVSSKVWQSHWKFQFSWSQLIVEWTPEPRKILSTLTFRFNCIWYHLLLLSIACSVLKAWHLNCVQLPGGFDWKKSDEDDLKKRKHDSESESEDEGDKVSMKVLDRTWSDICAFSYSYACCLNVLLGKYAAIFRTLIIFFVFLIYKWLSDRQREEDKETETCREKSWGRVSVSGKSSNFFYWFLSCKPYSLKWWTALMLFEVV